MLKKRRDVFLSFKLLYVLIIIMVLVVLTGCDKKDIVEEEDNFEEVKSDLNEEDQNKAKLTLDGLTVSNVIEEEESVYIGYETGPNYICKSTAIINNDSKDIGQLHIERVGFIGGEWTEIEEIELEAKYRVEYWEEEDNFEDGPTESSGETVVDSKDLRDFQKKHYQTVTYLEAGEIAKLEKEGVYHIYTSDPSGQTLESSNIIILIDEEETDSKIKRVSPLNSEIYLNDEKTEIKSYKIDDGVYIRLDDLAFALNNTRKKTNIELDLDNEDIHLSSGYPYNSSEEDENKNVEAKVAVFVSGDITLDGEKIELPGYYCIGKDIYIKLNDIKNILDLGVSKDKNNKISILTDEAEKEVEAEDKVYLDSVEGLLDDTVSLSNVLSIDDRYSEAGYGKTFICKSPAVLKTEGRLNFFEVSKIKFVDGESKFLEDMPLIGDSIATYYDNNTGMEEEIIIKHNENFDIEGYEEKYPEKVFVNGTVAPGAYFKLTKKGVYSIGVSGPGRNPDNVIGYIEIE